MDDPMNCSRCGQPHDRCKGHNRRGGPCRQWPLAGQEVCHLHGGKSPQALAKAEARIAQANAESAVATFGLPRDIDPHEALLEELHRTAGAVAWLGAVVAGLEQGDVVWGKVRDKVGGDDRGTTHEAGVNTWVRLWQAERAHLVAVSAQCIKAGIDERRMQLAEGAGEQLAAVLRGSLGMVLTALVEALAAHPVALEVVREVWNDVVGRAVTSQLRATAALTGRAEEPGGDQT